MSQSPTEEINDVNVASIRREIELKRGYLPYYGTATVAGSIITDMDHHPYTRFYRGVPNYHQPVIFEREAGWRPQRNACYEVSCSKKESPYPNHCFESACSTVYPCYPKISDKSDTSVRLTNECIIQYR